jgi:polar amino acid transport system substrate-binding protein
MLRFFLIFCLLSWCFSVAHAESELEPVRLQLDWKFQFEFAGFIAAKEKGFYQEAGLDVELLEYQAGTDTVSEVRSRRINYGIHNSSIVIESGKLVPIILLATYFQRSPLVLVTAKDIKTPTDLIGKTIMGTRDEFKYSSLALLLELFYVVKGNTTFQEHTFDIEDFITGRVDAMSAFRSNQLFELDQLGIEYNIIDPADYGFLMSAVNLFTSQEEALQYPQRTHRFIEASNRGWTYALEHPEEIINIIYSKYSQRKTLAALEYEVEVTRRLMLLDFYNIGDTNRELTIRALKQLQRNDLIDPAEQIGSFSFVELMRQVKHDALFNHEQRQYLEKKGVIKMCVDPDWMPFESISDGMHIGIAADIINSFSPHLPVPIELIKTTNWQQSIVEAKARRCDIFSLAAETPERIKYMDFTRPYLDLPVAMATTMDKYFIDDVAQIKDKRFGIVKGYAISEILRKRIPGINIIDVENISEGLRRVESGDLFGYIDNLMVIAAYLQQHFTGTLKISARLKDSIRLAIGTRNDEPLLRDIFDALIHSIDEDIKQASFNKWVTVPQDIGIDYLKMWKIAVGVVLVLLAFSYHYYRLRKYNRMLEQLSITDKLTGLYNRMKMDQALLLQQETALRYKLPSGIVLMDIDHFKAINDRHGHHAGDLVLSEFGRLLSRHVRKIDLVGRWGGEEFLVICPNTDREGTLQLAQKLLTQIRIHEFPVVGRVTASAGIGYLTEHNNIHKALEMADVAMYQAKGLGRDQVCVGVPAETNG